MDRYERLPYEDSVIEVVNALQKPIKKAPQEGVMDKIEIVITLPNSIVGNGEPGDSLSREVKTIIVALSQIMYWPLDFGESTANTTELIFLQAQTREEAERNAVHFIKKGGDV